jgi:fatty acid/phospholipid biosynthesis enzyme
VKAHGNSTRKEIRIAVEQCMTFVEQDIAHLIEIAVQPDNQKEMTENDI